MTTMSTEISSVLQAVSQFKAAFSSQASSTTKQISPNTFHAALSRGDNAFIATVLKKLETLDLQRFACQALVVYKNQSQCGDRAFAKPPPAEMLRKISNQRNSYAGTTPEMAFAQHFQCDHAGDELAFELPLSIAASSGCQDTVILLMENGANVSQQDSNGCTIVHSLVEMSGKCPLTAVNMFHYFVGIAGSNHAKTQLLLAEDKRQRTALDLAGRKCRHEMIQALLNTEGVYKFVVRECGIFRHVMYDVSEFESSNSKKTTFLYNLTYMTQEQLYAADESGFISSEPIKSWIKAKCATLDALVKMWAVAWVVYIVAYLVEMGIYLQDKEYISKALVITFIVVSAFAVVSEVAYFIVNWKLVRWPCRVADQPIVFTSGYRAIHIFFPITVIVVESLKLTSCICDPTCHDIFIVITVFSVMAAVLSVLFFCQLNSHTGYLLTMVEHMIFDCVLFSTISCIVIIAFAASFLVVYTSLLCTVERTPSNETTVRDTFATYGDSLYRTVLYSMAIIGPSDIYFEDAQVPSVAIAVYTLSLGMVYVVLMNLLVGIMSQRVTEIQAHKDSISVLETLSIYLFLEFKLKSKVNLMYGLHKLTPFHSRNFKKYFMCSNGGERVFIPVIELSNNSNNQAQTFTAGERTVPDVKHVHAAYIGNADSVSPVDLGASMSDTHETFLL